MSFVLSQEQRLLKQTAGDFVKSRSSLKRIRTLRDSADATGFSRDIWREMAELGWVGMLLPEDDGGSALGYMDLMMVMEELGRGLMPEPMLSTTLLGANAVLLGGSEAQRRELLPAIARGELLVALAYQEPSGRFDPHTVQTTAEPSGRGWKLRGEKCLVLDGHVADRILVSARTSGSIADRHGVTLFLIDPREHGVLVNRQMLVDSRIVASIRLSDVAVDESAIVGEPENGGNLLEAILDRATAGLCAEMLGAMSAAFEMTLEYLKTRKQFGVAIGTFQALKHRAAILYTEIELARSAVMGMNQALDEARPGASALVSVAKVSCSDAFLLAANEGVQMHGGIGMTDEHDIGFFLKRARAAEMTFGDAAWHRRRYAELEGY
ncbi:MAG: acyl-CoA dehydrogenase family protein [Deltaproteobacteria bacterium]|nr:acyl-CoA dehydrogenase family protein [Deltaproteobacteria bacterium]